MGVYIFAIFVGILACGLFAGTAIGMVQEKHIERGAAVLRSAGISLVGFIIVTVIEEQWHPRCAETFLFWCSKEAKHATSGIIVPAYIVGCIAGAIVSMVDWEEFGYQQDRRRTERDARARIEAEFNSARNLAYQENTVVSLMSFKERFKERAESDPELNRRIVRAKVQEEDADIEIARRTNTAAAYEAVLRKWGRDGLRTEEVSRYRDETAGREVAALRAKSENERLRSEAAEAEHQEINARNALRNSLLTMIENAEWLASDDKTNIVIPARNAIRGELNKIERNERITEKMFREPDVARKINELLSLVRTNEGANSVLQGSIMATLKVESSLRSVGDDKKMA